MKVFGIGDLHLSASGEKPMDVFGPQWEGHQRKIEQNWRAAVGADDVVLLCGDLTWAMKLDDALPDLAFIESLPGTKYFVRGNHDYWYDRPGRVRAILGPSMHLIRFDAAVHGGVGICGVRGWTWPGHPDYDPERDERYWTRARSRFGLSVAALQRLECRTAVAMFHYPPRDSYAPTELSQMVSDAGIRRCIYGHVHGVEAQNAIDGEYDGILYRCVSADRIGFMPLLILDTAAPS